MTILATKAAWRARAKTIRKTLDIPALSQSLTKVLRQTPLYLEASQILTYLAFGDELDLADLLKDNKQFYVPRSHLQPEPRLSIHAYNAAELERHPYGFWQPLGSSPEAAPSSLDLILVPGLAFDRWGARLGYGKGFYDRFLAALPSAVPRVGVIAEALIAERLPCDPHDMCMTHLLTEERLVLIPQ